MTLLTLLTGLCLLKVANGKTGHRSPEFPWFIQGDAAVATPHPILTLTPSHPCPHPSRLGTLTVFRALYKLLFPLWPNRDQVLAVVPGVGHGHLAPVADIGAAGLLQHRGTLLLPEGHGGGEAGGDRGHGGRGAGNETLG